MKIAVNHTHYQTDPNDKKNILILHNTYDISYYMAILIYTLYLCILIIGNNITFHKNPDTVIYRTLAANRLLIF